MPQSIASLTGRRIVVIGAVPGLGLVFVEALCTDGARVLLADFRTELHEKSVAQRREEVHDVHRVAVDVADPASVEACAAPALKRLDG